MKYQSLDAMVEQETRTLQPLEEEDVSLTIEEFPGAADKGMRLEARIKYADGVFSPWVSSREPVSHDLIQLGLRNNSSTESALQACTQFV